ncbi:bifunctional folylpolyglutamate synthase/dihydrofolate synthase [Flavihumibacter stibioxidans]|uniref:Dihydrofolate synthase/folylpolyglutamate synthase n=1 Tax=Flavihumibacter stibioxidans TaxID=1834163 RepID=A0ABR7M4M2_9BACT|nr:folylpolyglutamate synthase/dihydrofolate synthase family protein [Flavihumibacter stibioxidans]MBC6489809.1 dihydrofolate synthase [Flavihumibacter stibioxidans]
MTYAQTIDYLFTRLPMFSKQGTSAFKKDLHNIRLLEESNGNPHTKFKTIHIAGTNGKGSTSHMLAAILQKAGYKTGLYTSPHLKDFRERIRINGEMIPEQEVIDFTRRIIPMIDKLDPSFFEITVAMAFQWFADAEVDVAVIEVGLGGRLDSTNIITPEISVITNIGWDHMNLLGDSLDKIAIEKAGIIKPGIPVVIGETLPETRPVFEKTAEEKQATLYYAEQLQQVVNWTYEDHRLNITVKENGREDAQHYELDLPGAYQVKNVRTVMQTIRLLQRAGWHIDEAAIHQGLASARKLTSLHGRWELISRNPDTILDVGHNEDGIRAILQQLELTSHTHLHLVLGMVRDKDISKVLSLLPRQATYYFTQAHIPRALPAADLQSVAAEKGLHGSVYADVNAALQAAKSAAGKKDLVLVCGSVFLVGEVNH